MIVAAASSEIIYPSSDGKPMADNTLQWDWMTTIKFGIDDIFRADPNVFVASDLLWYPVQGQPRICAAPDVMVAFGRPKGFRHSYLQWNENNIPPQVVFEILSQSNTVREMMNKLAFYDEHGVEEYFQFDPSSRELSGWMRRGDALKPIRDIESGWTSPRLGVYFEVGDDLILRKPNGEQFPTGYELSEQRDEARREAQETRRENEEIRREKEELRRQYEESQREIESLRSRLKEKDA